MQAKLEAREEKQWSLYEMERTGGEPDVVGKDTSTGEYLFCDCAAESPKGRRSVCYDRAALEARTEHKPKDSAMDMAAAMGIELITNKRRIPGTARPEQFLYKKFKLNKNTCGCQKTRRRDLC